MHLMKRKQGAAAPPHGVPVEVVGLEVEAADGLHLYRKRSGEPLMAAPESLESMGFADAFCGPVRCTSCEGGE